MESQKQNLEGNVKKFYWSFFFREWMFIIPVVVLFWQQNGLSLTQIMLLQSIFAISIVLLEVPTGIVADKWGRKQSMMFGAICFLIGAVIYGLGHNFLQFSSAEIVLGASVSFFSGADSAFIYDTLKQTKKEKNFKKVLGNAKSLGYFAAGTVAVIGGFVAVYSMRLNWWLTALGATLAIIVISTFKEPKHYKSLKEKNYWSHTIECFKESFNNKNLLFLLLFSALLNAIARISLWFYQPYMKASGWDIAVFGVIWASFTLFAIAGSKSAHKLEEFLGVSKSLWLIILLSTFSLIFMGYWFALFGVIFIYAQQFLRGFYPPVIGDYSNKNIGSRKRATLLSIQGLAGSLLFAIVGPIFGYLADTISLSKALLFTGIIFFVAFLGLMIWKSQQNNKH